MPKKFQRKIEDFICGHCGAKVLGNGYTNHCPKCLYSKHVDVYPGDRAEPCGDLMQPIALEIKAGKYILTQQCEKCGIQRKNQVAENDDVNALINLSQTLAKKALF